jgi:hypothetical protein
MTDSPISANAIHGAADAGSLYPDDPAELARLVSGLLDEATRRASVSSEMDTPLGILIPHAGLSYSGLVAAAAWRQFRPPNIPDRVAVSNPADHAGHSGSTFVILGTSHAAEPARGVGVWNANAWQTPLGKVAIDVELANAIVALGPPFSVDLEAHNNERSIEVQLPFLSTVRPAARIVPLAASAGTDEAAIAAGRRLGELLSARRAAGDQIILVISSDMAHYPAAEAAEAATEALLPSIASIDATGVVQIERELRFGPSVVLICGMCGIEPMVLGLAALDAMGARVGIRLASATSADAGGPYDRTVGYLSVAFVA